MKLSRIAISLALFSFVLLSLNAIGFSAEKGLEEGGINEIVPAQYASRYLAWKKEFLSTQAGRDQWAIYENNPDFTLTITVSRENAEGAATGKCRWDQSGKLV